MHAHSVYRFAQYCACSVYAFSRGICKCMSSIHRKKRFPSFPSPAGMSITKLPLGRNNSVMTSLFPPRESLVVTSHPGWGRETREPFFYGVCIFATNTKQNGKCYAVIPPNRWCPKPGSQISWLDTFKII